MSEKYFLWHFSEDGDPPTCKVLDRDGLLREITPRKDESPMKFLDSVPSNFDYTGGVYLIIMGNVIVPKPKTVALTFDV